MSRIYRALEKVEEEKKQKIKEEPSLKVFEEKAVLKKEVPTLKFPEEKIEKGGGSFKRSSSCFDCSVQFFWSRSIPETKESDFSSSREFSPFDSRYECSTGRGENPGGC